MRDRADRGRRAPRYRFERALRALLLAGRPAPGPHADIQLRLEHLAEGLEETRGRVNTLFFAVLGALVLDLVGRAALG
jgi:hypothetical protein